MKKNGRPLLFKSAAQLEKKINEYFDACDNRIVEVLSMGKVVKVKSPAPYGMAGLAYHLGMERRTLINYGKRDKFFLTIRKARARVEKDIENRLMEANTTGAIFNLKNNFGWEDKTRSENSNEIKIISEFYDE